ncbi:hypothetical protein [Paracoccus ravus]|uniref:hypothetical protein n=1 Tax=Paracoccus ravus TaxID=2447760 RepID=UPI00106E58DA|nr:hypothetical protein [Paracoccus ravus]
MGSFGPRRMAELHDGRHDREPASLSIGEGQAGRRCGERARADRGISLHRHLSEVHSVGEQVPPFNPLDHPLLQTDLAVTMGRFGAKLDNHSSHP